MHLEDKIVAKLHDGDSIVMHHFRYHHYTPIRYVANTYGSGPEFLMTPNFWPGQTLNSKMKQLNVQSIIGPKTLNLLESMGYATISNPQTLELEVLDD